MKKNSGSVANDLSIQQLRSFCTVYELAGYSGAARKTGLAVPTIWEQVQAVERCYGTKLFQREGRQIVTTAAARALYESLSPVLVGLDSTFEVVHESEGTGESHLTIVTGMRMLLEELGGYLSKFAIQAPNVSLRLLHGDNKTAEKLIENDEADFGLTLEPGPNMAKSSLTYEQAYEVEYLAVVPEGHPLAAKRNLHLKDLIKHPLVVGHEETSGRRVLDEALHREGLLEKANIVIETDNSAFTAACVRSGLGVGILAGKADGPLTQDLVGLSLQKQLGHARIVFLWRKGRHLTDVTRSLMELVKQR